jgi:hypothetical protein
LHTRLTAFSGLTYGENADIVSGLFAVLVLESCRFWSSLACWEFVNHNTSGIKAQHTNALPVLAFIPSPGRSLARHGQFILHPDSSGRARTRLIGEQIFSPRRLVRIFSLSPGKLSVPKLG